jgi:NADPH2:quinone reductase
MECAGEIEAVGAGVTGWNVGDRVMVLGMNAYAEKMACKPGDLYPMPDGLGFDEAAALPVQGITAHHLLGLQGRFARGERVLVQAAAGGVGTLAVQMAKHMGAAAVVGSAGSEEKRALVRELGADACVDSRDEGFWAKARDAAGGAFDVIIEMTGGSEAYKRDLSVLAPFGRLVVFGAASGDRRGTIEPVGLMGKNQTVTGYYLTPVLARRDLCAPPLAEIARDVVAKKLRVIVGARYPLADAIEAHRAMESRGTQGKIVLVP